MVLYFSGFTTGTPPPSIHDTCPVHLILLYLLAQIVFGEDYQARSCSLRSITQFHGLYLHKELGNPTDRHIHNMSDTNKDVQFFNSWQASSIKHCSYFHYCFIVTPVRNRQVEGQPLVGHPLLAQRAIRYPKASPPFLSWYSYMKYSQWTIGRRIYKWENNIKMHLEEKRRDRVDCVIRLKLGRCAVSCERGNEHSVCVKCGELNVQVNANCTI